MELVVEPCSGETKIHSQETFDWSILRADAGRKSYIQIEGFANNVNNFDGMKVSSYDESAGTITLEGANWDFIDENTVTGISISIESQFYFTDEMNDNWIGQFPYGVTMFQFYSTTDGASALLGKVGVYSNTSHQRAKIRFEEELTDDFINGSDDGLLNWREANEKGSTTYSSSDVDENHPGILRQRLNNGETGNVRTQTSLGLDALIVSNMRVGISGIVKPITNAFTTVNVKYYFGYTDHAQWNSTKDGFYFEIAADGAGKGRVFCVGEDNNVRTVYDTGIDLTEDDWFVLHIGKPAHSGTIHFAINDIIVHEMEQSVIGMGANITPAFGSTYAYQATPLPNNKDWFVDAFALKYRMSQDRI